MMKIDHRLYKATSVATDSFKALAPFIKSPSVFSFVRGAFEIVKSVLDNYGSLYIDDYFYDGKQWEQFMDESFCSLIRRVLLKNHEHNDIFSLGENNKRCARIVTLDKDTKIGWLANINDANGTGVSYCGETNVYVTTGRYEHACKLLKTMLWNEFGNSSLVIKNNKRKYVLGSPDKNEDVTFSVDIACNMTCEKTFMCTTYLKRYLERDIHRSLLFYGPPGTGKSTLARSISQQMGAKHLRVSVRDLDNIDDKTLSDAILIFEPEVVILDDFDRMNDQARFLDMLENMHHIVKVTIATVNRRNAMDEALLRPGRFDELIAIERMDDDVLLAILGEHKALFDTVKSWPIAYTQELIKRLNIMSPEEAVDSVRELSDRVERLQAYTDDNNVVNIGNRKVHKDDDVKRCANEKKSYTCVT